MAASRVNPSASLRCVLPLPFGRYKEVTFDFEELLEEQRETLRRGLFQREHLDVVVVQAQKSTMAFEMRLAEIEIEKGVVFEFREIKLLGCEVEDFLQHPEGVLLAEQLDTEKVVNLEQEARDFLIENSLGAADFIVDEYDLLFRRQESDKFVPPAMFGAVAAIIVIAIAENAPKVPFSLSRF